MGGEKKSFLFNDSVKKCNSELIGLFFAKTGLMAGKRNCSYSPFSLAKSVCVDLLFS